MLLSFARIDLISTTCLLLMCNAVPMR